MVCGWRVCQSCQVVNTVAIRSLGIEDEQIAALEQSLEPVAFDPKEAALIDFARQADRKPHAVTDAQFDKLRETGAQDVKGRLIQADVSDREDSG